MKKTIILISLLSLITFFGNTQTTENLDYVSTFNEGLAAVKKGNQWAFINTNGQLVINFRSDLVSTESEDGTYPIFKNGRCLVEEKKEGISYYGYIDITGKEIIEPQFLNATNFKDEVAIVIYLVSEELGKNNLLGKDMVNYKYFEVAIDLQGAIITYLTKEGTTIILDKKSLKKSPAITSRLISKNLIAVKMENNKWTIKKIEDQSL